LYLSASFIYRPINKILIKFYLKYVQRTLIVDHCNLRTELAADTYAALILNNVHLHGPINNNMYVLNQVNKGPFELL
jgi:hypothetical protein